MVKQFPLCHFVYVLTSPHNLSKWTKEIEKPVLLPYLGEGGLLIPFAGQSCGPLGSV